MAWPRSFAGSGVTTTTTGPDLTGSARVGWSVAAATNATATISKRGGMPTICSIRANATGSRFARGTAEARFAPGIPTQDRLPSGWFALSDNRPDHKRGRWFPLLRIVPEYAG